MNCIWSSSGHFLRARKTWTRAQPFAEHSTKNTLSFRLGSGNVFDSDSNDRFGPYQLELILVLGGRLPRRTVYMNAPLTMVHLTIPSLNVAKLHLGSTGSTRGISQFSRRCRYVVTPAQDILSS